MARPKYDLETLREKCTGYGNVGVGARQLGFVFQQYDAEKARANLAEMNLTGLQQGVRNLATELEKWAGCPMGVQIVPMSFGLCDSCSKRGEDVVDCWVRYGQSFMPEAPHA